AAWLNLTEIWLPSANPATVIVRGGAAAAGPPARWAAMGAAISEVMATIEATNGGTGRMRVSSGRRAASGGVDTLHEIQRPVSVPGPESASCGLRHVEIRTGQARGGPRAPLRALLQRRVGRMERIF